MKAMTKLAVTGALAFGLGSLVQAADLNGAVAYSLGEFDRVGSSQPLPKTESGKTQKVSTTKFAQSAQNREMDTQKAEFVRRMFWMALSMR